MNSSLSFIDAAIVIGYICGVLAVGLWVGRGQQNTLDYFLGGRLIPWWAVLLSIVATETSTVTFLSIPGFSFARENGDFRFLQITFGYIVGRILVVFVLLPLYFRGQPFTSYEVLQSRFGIASRQATSMLFLITRNLSDALRLYLTALAMQQAVGLGISTCVVILGIVTIAYTFFGGVRSVVWNDCIQFSIYMIGAIVTLAVIVSQLPGKADQLWQFGQQFDKFRVLDFELSLTKPTMTFWAGLVGGLFLTAATHGTDQLMVQRYLTAKNQRSASWALALSGIVVCGQFALFLAIGLALACFYRQFPGEVEFVGADGDRVFAHFIVNHLGRGLVGLILAAVFAAAMSTLSSSLNSSATALIKDIYLPLLKRQLSPARELWMSRLATAGFGVLQICIALASQHIGASVSTVGKVLAIAGFAMGPVLGLYFLAVFAKRVRQRSALAGFAAGIALLSYVALATPLYWPWYAGFGATTTFLFGLLFSLFQQEPQIDSAKRDKESVPWWRRL